MAWFAAIVIAAVLIALSLWGYDRFVNPQARIDPEALEGVRFPAVRGSSLSGRSYTLPQDIEGEIALVMIAFQQVHQFDVNTWLPVARDLSQQYEALAYYELPTIDRLNPAARTFIDGGMRAGIPDPVARATTITLYLDKPAFRQALEIPDVGVSGRGKAIVNLLDLQPGETMTSVVAVKDFSEDKYIVMLATNGQIKKTHLSEFRNVRRGGIIAMSLRPKSQLMWSRLTDGKREIIIATRLGKAIRFSEKDIRPMGRTAAGVRGMRLAKKDEVIGMVSIGEAEKYVFTASEKGYGKRTEVDSYRKTHRGGKGLINLKVTSKIGPAVAVLGVAEDDLLIVTLSGKVIRIQTKQVRAVGRATQGVRLINLENGDKICSVAKAEED